jgi:hypothetical protein
MVLNCRILLSTCLQFQQRLKIRTTLCATLVERLWHLDPIKTLGNSFFRLTFQEAIENHVVIFYWDGLRLSSLGNCESNTKQFNAIIYTGL